MKLSIIKSWCLYHGMKSLQKGMHPQHLSCPLNWFWLQGTSDSLTLKHIIYNIYWKMEMGKLKVGLRFLMFLKLMLFNNKCLTQKSTFTLYSSMSSTTYVKNVTLSFWMDLILLFYNQSSNYSIWLV